MSDAAPVEFYGKNDLFVEVSFGGIKYRTITQNDVGANATFEIGDRAQGKFRVQVLFDLDFYPNLSQLNPIVPQLNRYLILREQDIPSIRLELKVFLRFNPMVSMI